jgi:hypothetical protein
MKAPIPLVLTLLVLAAPAARSETRYFLMSDGNPDNNFVFALHDPKQVQEALDIIAGKRQPVPHVSGIIDTFSAPYNRPWGFHYEPSTIAFPEVSIEVCDAETSYVQAHLAEVGGHFLPGYRWCPWSQRVVREVPGPQ